MNARQLTQLGVVTIAIIAGAIWIGLASRPGTEANAALYPTLKGQLDKVHAVQIYQADRLAVELKRTTTGWNLTQRSEHPANAGMVNALLLSLESAQVREEKTSNPANYATLGVNETNASGARVELVGVDPPIKLIVGKVDATRASYVRRAGEVTSWLVSEQLTVPIDTAQWLHRDLLNIGADRIQEVIVQLSGSPRYSVVKAQRSDTHFDVMPLPKQRELNSVSVANAAAQALTNLQLDDVRPVAAIGNAKSVAQTSFRTFDGVVVDVSGYLLDDKQWITVKASVDAALTKRLQTQTAVNDKIDETIQTEINALNQLASNWMYAIPAYKYDAIFKPVEQLLKK